MFDFQTFVALKQSYWMEQLEYVEIMSVANISMVNGEYMTKVSQVWEINWGLNQFNIIVSGNERNCENDVNKSIKWK